MTDGKRQMTLEEFVASARLTHWDEMTEVERCHATNYDGHEVVVFEGGHALCKEGSEYWFEDYKDRFRGSWDEIVEKFHRFLLVEGGLPV